MTAITALQAKSGTEPQHGVRIGGRLLRAAVVGATLACAVPAAVSTASAQTEAQTGASYEVAFLGVPSQAVTPALTPGMPPAQFVAPGSGEDAGMSTRSIAAGFILVLFAGLAALTFTMWRDLGRRVGAR